MKPAYFVRSGDTWSGIDITWTRSTRRLSVSGWYDGMVGIEGENVSDVEFFKRIGMTAADLRRAANDLDAGNRP